MKKPGLQAALVSWFFVILARSAFHEQGACAVEFGFREALISVTQHSPFRKDARIGIIQNTETLRIRMGFEPLRDLCAAHKAMASMTASGFFSVVAALSK